MRLDDFFFFIICLFGLFFVILPIVSIVMSVRNGRRIREIQAYLSGLASTPAAPAVIKTAPPATAAATQHSHVNAPHRVPTSQTTFEPTSIDKAFMWFRENWLLAIGALFMLFAFGWLTRYAFMNNWIGPMGRITLGIALGAAILTLGQWRIRAFAQQGSIFMVLGSATILLTVFAAREMYGFFTPVSALAVMFLTTAFVAFSSVHHRISSLSYISLVMAGIAPMLTNSATGNFVGLFSYLLIIIAGTLWVVSVTGWRKNIVLALLVAGAYSLPFVTAPYRLPDVTTGLAFAFLLTAIFFVVNLIGNLKPQGDNKPNLVAAALTAVFLIVWILGVAPKEWQSLWLSLWMLVFAGGSFALFKKTENAEGFFIYSGVSLILLLAATAVELSGPTLTLALTLEALLLPVGTHLLLKDTRIAANSSALLLLPILASGDSISYWAWRDQDHLLHDHFFVLLFLTLVPLTLAWFFIGREREGKADMSGHRLTLGAWIVAGSFYGYMLVWRALHAVMVDQDIATMWALIIYTISGLGAYILGHISEIKPARVYGMLMLGWVVFRLLFIDMGHMGITGRIITFFLIGALLLATAFIEYRGRRKKL